jgi:hypothetical protein
MSNRLTYKKNPHFFLVWMGWDMGVGQKGILLIFFSYAQFHATAWQTIL